MSAFVEIYSDKTLSKVGNKETIERTFILDISVSCGSELMDFLTWHKHLQGQGTENYINAELDSEQLKELFNDFIEESEDEVMKEVISKALPKVEDEEFYTVHICW